MAHTETVELVENQGWDERILVCGNGRLVHTFVVITERFVVVVDTMINARTAQAIMGYAETYLRNGRQLLVVNTHADYDHAWGNQIFVGPEAQYPAPIIGSYLSPAIFKQEASQAFLAQVQKNEPDIFSGLQLVPPNLLIHDTFVIEGGDLTLQLLPTPGHTTDHYSIYIPEIKTLLAADAAELPYPVARTTAGLPGMRASLAKLAALGAETVLYCHAPVTTGPQLLQDNMAYFDRIEAACRAALTVGLPEIDDETDVLALVDVPYATAVPNHPAWQEVHPYYQTQGHADQVRMMLAWLQDQDNLGQQPIIVSERERPFATSAVALQAIIINEQEQLLLLSSPRRNGQNEWQTVSGGLEAGETLLAGVLREVSEEVGPIQVRPLGVIHAQTFHYDSQVRYMIGIYYLLVYEGGRVQPGDDMANSQVRWWGLEELETAVTNCAITFHQSTHLWMLQRAVAFYRHWPETVSGVLQPDIDDL